MTASGYTHHIDETFLLAFCISVSRLDLKEKLAKCPHLSKQNKKQLGRLESLAPCHGLLPQLLIEVKDQMCMQVVRAKAPALEGSACSARRGQTSEDSAWSGGYDFCHGDVLLDTTNMDHDFDADFTYSSRRHS
jgi:hypothetical protein